MQNIETGIPPPATFEATKKRTLPLKNWGKVYGELSIMYEGRLG